MQPYGGFWRRVLAYIIDVIALNIGQSLLAGLFGLGLGFASMMADPTGEGGLPPGYWPFVGFSMLLQWLYFALLEASPWQATLGKKVLGMVVTDLDGNRISFARATGRYVAKILSGVILMIGYIMVGFTQRKQGLHDMLASTLVYKASAADQLTTSAEVFE